MIASQVDPAARVREIELAKARVVELTCAKRAIEVRFEVILARGNGAAS